MKQIRIRRKSRPPFRCLWMCLVIALVSGLTASPALAAPPDNDEFATAKAVPKLPYSDKMDATNATASETDPSESVGTSDYPLCSNGGTVWYQFTPNNDVRLVADTLGSDFNTVLAAFAGPPSKGSMVGCNDDWRSPQSRVSFEAKSGQNYYFMVSGASPGVLKFNLRAAIPPTNDEMARAKNIKVELPYKDKVDTTDATLNINDPSCSGRARSVWYKYSRPKNWDPRRIELSTRGSDYYTTMSVYTGPRYDLKQIECNSSTTPRVRFLTEPGTTYWVMVAAANNSQGGSLTLRAKNMPIPFKLRVGVDGAGRISSVTGAAHIGGRIECTKKAPVEIYVLMRQQQPNGTVRSAEAHKEMTCDEKRAWGVNLVADEKSFTEGPAGVWVKIEVPTRDRNRNEKKVVQLESCERCV